MPQENVEPEFPALIHAPRHPLEPCLVPLPTFGHFVERMNDHYSPGPDHWRPIDRLIDASGRTYSITWGGQNDETGGDYFITPLTHICSPEEMVQLLKDHHEYLERKPTKYINHVNTIDRNQIVRESIAYVSTLPRCRPILSPRNQGRLLVVVTLLLIAAILVILFRM